MLFSPWVKGTRQLMMAAETIPLSCTREDECDISIVKGLIAKMSSMPSSKRKCVNGTETGV